MEFTFAQTVWLHVIVAIPATLAAVAALVKATHVHRDTRQIIVAVNGERETLRAELAALRTQLAQRRPKDRV